MWKIIIGALVLVGCVAPEGTKLVRIDGGPARIADHPITQLDIRQCEKLRERFGDEACTVTYIN